MHRWRQIGFLVDLMMRVLQQKHISKKKKNKQGKIGTRTEGNTNLQEGMKRIQERLTAEEEYMCQTEQ